VGNDLPLFLCNRFGGLLPANFHRVRIAERFSRISLLSQQTPSLARSAHTLLDQTLHLCLCIYNHHSNTTFMIIVHDIFICKPGNASKLAKLFKETMSKHKETVNIMTDMTGQYNRVVIVSQFESLAAYEKSWDSMTEEDKKKMQEAMKGYTEMYLTGSREIYQVW
jgi:heme-degrading monooxygenase HmoA